MAQHKSLGVLSRYEQIALDIASRILRDEYKVGDKIFGRPHGRSVQEFRQNHAGCGLLQDAEVVETAPVWGITSQEGGGIIFSSV